MSKYLLIVILCLTQLQLLTASVNNGKLITKEYCIVGAGPSGLQIGYYMQRSGSDYVVLERAAHAGAFFAYYPRHRRLISINKRWADSSNTEYMLRHDWNSLLSDNPKLQFRHYSKEMFPHSGIMVDYLKDYQRENNISVHFNTEVQSIQKLPSGQFVISTTNKTAYDCKVVVMATGLPKLREAEFPGSEFTVGYDKVSTNASDFEGKRVLIIGKGNAGFEIAQHIYGRTRFVHVVGRHPVRFAWSTHYVGDLRAVNNELLDTYQLKSLDGMFESDLLAIVKNAEGELCLDPADNRLPRNPDVKFETREQQQYCYDIVVRATGFVWDSAPLRGLNLTTTFKNKYPAIAHQFESADVNNLFFAGTIAHSLDFRQAAGGFVHGFRYTARALFRYLRSRRHGQEWPSIQGPVSSLLDVMVKRINEGSGNYQMFSFLGDVILISKDKTRFTLLEEFPVKLLHVLPKVTRHRVESDIFVFIFEYGRNFSGPRHDTFRSDRAGCEPSTADHCNFLHPVIYHYDQLPNKTQMYDRELKKRKLVLPRPKQLLHLMEDFFTSFRNENHLMPLASFLEQQLNRPVTPLSEETCLSQALVHGSQPEACGSIFRDSFWSLAEMLK